jgi:hypothetical protein
MDLRNRIRLGIVALAIALIAALGGEAELRANARPRGAGILVH